MDPNTQASLQGDGIADNGFDSSYYKHVNHQSFQINNETGNNDNTNFGSSQDMQNVSLTASMQDYTTQEKSLSSINMGKM